MKSSSRNLNIELVRLIASFGVIAIHVHSTTQWAEYLSFLFIPLCVPYFFTASIVFFVGGLGKYSTKEVFSKTWERIAIPFLSWTTIYSSLLYIKYITVGSRVTMLFWRVWLFGESAVHLYYLVTLIILQLIALALYLIFIDKKKVRNGLLLLAVCSIYVFFALLNKAAGFRNSYFFLGFLLYIGFAFSKKYMLWKVFSMVGSQYVYALILLIMYGCYWSDFLGMRDIFPLFAPIYGICVFQITSNIPEIKLSKWIVSLSTMSYGIYLSHILFLEIAEFIIEKNVIKGITYNLPSKLIIVCLIISFSSILVIVVRKISILKLLLLGEK